MRRNWTATFISLIVASVCLAASYSVTVMLSPRNIRRPYLRQIQYIVLHTTEGGAKGSLSKLRKHGEAHYMIDTEGKIIQLIEENREARHSGRSLWNGRSRLDENSIGIEMVGYHYNPLTPAQETSLAALLKDLKAKYSVTDDHVLTHSMVAYGVPNRWHSFLHRGRKRCGMLMADPEQRARLGLNAAPKYDPDVESGRLKVADSFLFSLLFGRTKDAVQAAKTLYAATDSNVVSAERNPWFIARESYNSVSTVYSLPTGQRLTGNQIHDWNSLPYGTKVSFQDSEWTPETPFGEQNMADLRPEFKEVGIDGQTAFQIARTQMAAATTIYIMPDGYVTNGRELAATDKNLLAQLPKGTKILVGYVNGGAVTDDKPASQITGPRWNSPSTVYRFANGEVLTGDDVNLAAVPNDTLVFYEQ